MVSSRQGFTLLELMIVITVMGTMAALLAPGIGEFMADARASSATEDLVRLSRHIRSRAQETGLAHLMVFGRTSNDRGGLGIFRVYEGMNNHCRTTPWPQTIGGSLSDGHAPVETLDMLTYNPSGKGLNPTVGDADRQVIAVTAQTGTDPSPTAVILCSEPGGTTYEGATDASLAGFAFTRQTVNIKFTITRTVNSEQHGITREVNFPPGGVARFRF
jgi:prepilin-type N-terminal cleavage/methylation domain-containing protein